MTIYKGGVIMSAKARSPGYPAIGLREAVERVRAVYHKDFQNKLPRAIVANHMGYKGLSGASLPVLAALGQYGLLEGRGDETRVSDMSLRIIAHEPGNAERLTALQEAATGPELFAELHQKFPEGKASDAAIKAHLLINKFLPVAADTVIRSYRDTIDLLTEEEQAYRRQNPEAAFQVDMSEQQGDFMEINVGRQHFRPATSEPERHAVQGMRKEIITLDEGDVVITFPDGLSAESVDDLSAHLQLFIRKAQRRSGSPSEAKKEEAAH